MINILIRSKKKKPKRALYDQGLVCQIFYICQKLVMCVAEFFYSNRNILFSFIIKRYINSVA